MLSTARSMSTPKGFVHSFETGGTVDGPGVRLVVFMAGCPLRCQYCHNPDMQKMSGGKAMSLDEVMTEIKSHAGFIKRARGGVTISGGEPLAQGPFVTEILRACKAEGLHTALDSSGYSGHEDHALTADLLDQLDMVLLDVKSGLPDVYKEVTGAELAPTIRTLKRLGARDIDVWVRFVLVPDLTDSEDNIRAVASLLKEHEVGVKRVDILPFHKMGEYKWRMLGKTYRLADTHAATPDDVERALSIFAEYGIEAV